MISVRHIDGNTYEVTVEAASTTTHRVSLSDEYYLELTNETVNKEDLIKKSFEFLLERENNSMILTQFDLPVIQRYFSDYEGEIKQRVKR